jgi:hypothetical protein
MVLPRQENIMRVPRYLSALISLAALLAGCDPTALLPTGTPDAGSGARSTRTSLTHNDLHHNSLRADVLTANAALRARLATSALNQRTFEELQADGIAFGVNDESKSMTMDLMEYVVSCALLPEAEVKVAETTWRGELGLCSEWATDVPDDACLSRVSSCVIARVNARNRKVIISMRGESMPRGPDLFPLQRRVPVEQELREEGGTPIHSFRDCSGDAAPPDCGFEPLYVGMCNAGEEVTVCAGGTCDCSAPISEPDLSVTLRVCKGLYGCDSTPFDASTYPGQLKDTPTYAGRLEDAHAACADAMSQKRPAVTFTCPANGPVLNGSQRGYYSVMIAPGNGASSRRPSSPVPKAVKDGVVDTRRTYPAREVDVFTYREGAFYGNLFSTSAKLDTNPTMLSGDTYACFGERWADGLATFADRFCALDAVCFDHTPMGCFQPKGDRCESDSGMPGEFYERCSGIAVPPARPAEWAAPITVYLNGPCDLSDKCDVDPLSK